MYVCVCACSCTYAGACDVIASGTCDVDLGCVDHSVLQSVIHYTQEAGNSCSEGRRKQTLYMDKETTTAIGQ